MVKTIYIKRKWFTDESTIGELEGGNFSCFTLEDPERNEKIYGKTAIPRGRYRVVITYSNRFKRRMPLLLDVPGFEAIRIHSGNKAVDTEGCILVGMTRSLNWISRSREAYSILFKMIDNALRDGNEVWVEIS